MATNFQLSGVDLESLFEPIAAFSKPADVSFRGVANSNDSGAALLQDHSWTAISAGNEHTVAIRSDYKLFAWGLNNIGQLGDGMFPLVTKSSPVQIGSSSWVAVAAGSGRSRAIRSDGKLFGWGGDPGDGSAYSISPVQIGSDSWIAVSVNETSAAIRSDYKLFTWGTNSFGELGDGTTIGKSSPVQIGSSSWTAISTGKYHLAAITSDYKLFTWGRGANGRLGNGTTSNISSPVQVGTSSWTAVAAGTYHTAAIRLDYKLFTWGSNDLGELGDGTTLSKSSPVQIGTSSWTAVSAGGYHTVGLMKASA